MPAQSKGQVIQRQWELLRLIPSHDIPERTTAELSGARYRRVCAEAREPFAKEHLLSVIESHP
jgi:hypothetical protein